MNRTLTAALIAALATPAMAGGPVVVEEEEVVAAAPARGDMIVPILLLVAIGFAVASGSNEDRCYGSASCF
jgi:hypothetical protein